MYNGKVVEFDLTGVSLSNAMKRGFINLRASKNIKITKDGISKAPGLRLFGTFADPVIGLGIQAVSGTLKRLLSASDDKLYKEVSGDIDNTILASGIDFGRSVTMVPCGREIFASDAKQIILGPTFAPRGLTGDGVTAPLLTDVPTDWSSANPESAVSHDGRVVAWLLDRLYFSNLDDHFDFITDAPPIISVDAGYGDRISAAISYLPTTLFIFKYPFGVYRLDTTDITADLLPLSTVTKAVGCVGPKAVCQVPGGIAFVTASGEIAYFQANNTSEDVELTYLTSDLNDIREQLIEIVDPVRLDSAQLVYDDKAKTLIYTFTSRESVSLNDRCFSFQIDNKFNITEEFIEDSYHTILPYYNPTEGRFYIQAGQSGNVWFRDSDAFAMLDDSGSTIDNYYIEFETSLNEWLDNAGISTAVKEKRFDWIEFEGVIRGNHKLNMSTSINGLASIPEEIDLMTGSAEFDEALFDEATFAGADVWRVKRPITRRGRTFSVRLVDTLAPDSDFLITKCRVYYQDGDIGGTS